MFYWGVLRRVLLVLVVLALLWLAVLWAVQPGSAP
jgi:hypothetical protein